jgi:predicted ATPase with chaperone activity
LIYAAIGVTPLPSAMFFKTQSAFGRQLNQSMFLGELSLEGSIRSARAALSVALAA